jgi:trehalose 6-phosphate phosphatase
LTVHYRAAADPATAEMLLRPRLSEVASRHGLSMFEAKMALEVAASAVPGKGAVVARLVGERGLRACLFAGDDLPDLDAFAALDRLAGQDLVAVKVAVRSEETPQAVLDAADLVVDRPAGLVAMLGRLATPAGPRPGG